MSHLSPEPSRLTQSSQRCEGAAMNWKYTQIHPNSSLLNSQRCEGCPTVSLDWEMSVYMNTHNIPSDTSHPLSLSLSVTTSQLQMRAVQHTRIQAHKHTIQVGWMLNVTRSVQIKPTQVRNSEVAYLILASQTENTHTCTHKWSHKVSVCWMHNKTGATMGGGKGAGYRPPHHLFPSSATGASSLFAYVDSFNPGLSLASSLLRPPQNNTLSRLQPVIESIQSM